MAKKQPITNKKQAVQNVSAVSAKPQKRPTQSVVQNSSKTTKISKKIAQKKTIKIKKSTAVIFSAQQLEQKGSKIFQQQKEKLQALLETLKQRISSVRDSARDSVRASAKTLAKPKTPSKAKKKKPSHIAKAWKNFTKQTRRSVRNTTKKTSKSLRSTQKSIRRAVRAFFVGIGLFIWHEILGPFVYIFRYHFFLTTFCLLLTGAILGGSYYVYDLAFKDLPSIDQLQTRKQILTTKILDRNGALLYQIYRDENRTLIPLSQVPVDMRHATIAIEDRGFETHQGISVRGIVRALFSNAQSDHVQGGSTITQQLVKNTLLTSERTFKRKVREILLAIMVERAYSKDEILEMYFNEVPYGGSTYGIEEAAERYFGVHAKDLDLAQSAFLAGLPAAPSVYSPFGQNPQLAYERQHEVLNSMVGEHYITADQAQAARNEVLKFRQDVTDIKAPHFVMYVKSLLEKQYGEDLLEQGGLVIRTTLDLDTQNKTQDIVTREVNNLNRLHITNGAALITNPKTGEILTMVGSKNYFDFANDGQVNVTISPRQPGSSIKPLTYALAFEKNGYTPSTTIVDEPTTFNSPGSPPYSPKNYDGKFHGVVTVREALASSYNIPAVKTLATVGISNMIDKAEEMGVTTWEDRQRFGLSLTLGGGEVMMTELAQIYGTLANSGETVQLNPILEVKNAKGDVLYRNTCALDNTDCPQTRTLDSKVTYEITDILSDNNARTPAFGPRSVLYIPNQQVAVKTGTTNNLKDNWAIGYTEDRLVAVWVGNNDGSPMSYVASGITGASPIWNYIMRTQLDDAHPHVFSVPEGMVKVRICARTNTLPCQGCPYIREELFISGTEPTQACNPAQFAPQPSPSPGQPGDKILQGVTIGQ